MSRVALIVCVLTLGVMTVSAQQKPAALPSATKVRKPAATPEDALAQLVAAGKAKDIDGILFYCTDEAAKLSRELFKLDDDYRAASQSLASAVGTRFGAAGENDDEFFSGEGDDKSAFAAWCAGQKIVGKTNLPGGKVQLKLESTVPDVDDKGQPIQRKETTDAIAVKQGDTWRLIPPTLPSAGQADEIRYAMPRLAQVSRDLGVAVKAGKYETREEVTTAYNAGRQRVILSIKNPIVFKDEADRAKR